MNKVKIGNNPFVYPMPMVLVGTVIDDRANFMAVGWVSRVNFNPPMIAVALGKFHYTNAGIHKNKTFSVNIPGIDLIEKVDYCGLVSGEKVDKSKLFDVFYGNLPAAPMIRECPLCMECKLFNAVDLPSNTLFIGEIIETYTEGRYLTDGKPDIKKMNPFTLTMPDNNYWRVGENAGKAWSIGNNFRKQSE
ncbi:MAG: flavin reductase family protein [Deltaproteobacteria bacterium]|nr:flavin reductase family protein [Deltaproteobacteria bacterium]